MHPTHSKKRSRQLLFLTYRNFDLYHSKNIHLLDLLSHIYIATVTRK